MAEKRYTVVFDAKDMASARLSLIEQQARKTSRGMGELERRIDSVAETVERMTNSYRDANSGLRDMNGRFLGVTEAVRGTNTEVDRSGGLLSRMGSEFSRIGTDARSSIGSLSSSLTGIVGILGSISTAAIGAGTAITTLAARGVWDHILQPAMDKETNKIQIEALSGSPKLGKEIYGMADVFGRNSMFDSSQVMQGTFSFMQNTKDPEKLKEILSITERLAVLNKDEGFSGASFSMKEAMSGDIQSMAERFNVAKKELRSNGFDSNASWQTNLTAVDTTLSKMNVNDDLINKIQDSTPARFDKLKKDTRLAFADMGGGMLSEMRPALFELNNLFEDQKGLRSFTRSMSETMGTAAEKVFGLGDGVDVTWKDITSWSQSTFKGVAEVVESLGGTFTSTMSLLSGEDLSGPKEAFQSFGKVLSGISDVIDTINTGIKGMKEVSDWSDSYFEGVSNMNENLYGDSRYGLLTGWTKPIVDMFSDDEDGSHALGLSYVPKDNYRANLHEGERVLTKQENIAYMQGPGNASSSGVVINIQSMSVRNEQDINAIGEQLVMRLKRTE